MALIKKWSLGKLGEGPITLDGVTYTQGLDENDKPGIEGYVPVDYVDWETDNRPLVNLVDNDEKLNEHIEINSRQIGNGIFQELGNQFLISIVDNKLTKEEIYDIIKFKEERFKVVNMKLPVGYRYLWIDIEEDLNGNFTTIRGTETTEDTARWYWRQWVDGVITDNTFGEVDTSSVIADTDDKVLIKEVLNNRARLEGITPIHVSSGVAFISGNYSTVKESKPVYDEGSYHIVGPTTHYDTSSGANTLIKDIEEEIKIRYADASPETWEVTLVVREVDTTGVDPHEEYDLHITIGANNFQYSGQFITLIVSEFIWDQGEVVDLLYEKLFGIGEILIPNPAQIYDISGENTPFSEYDPRYKLETSGYAYPQSADPNVIVRKAGSRFACDDKGILPVSNAEIFREFEVKETFIDTSGAVGSVADVTIPIKDQSTQIELSYEISSHIEAAEGRWDDFYGTWIEGYEPIPGEVKNVEAIAEFDSAIYFSYHHKLYRLVQNPNLPEPDFGPSLDDISTSVDGGEFTFGLTSLPVANRVAGNTSDDFDATETVTALQVYNEWLYIGTSNGYIFRFQQGATGADNTIEQITVCGAPGALGGINALYVWGVPNQLAIATNNGFRLLEHSNGNAVNVTIVDLGTETPLLSSTVVTAFTETSKYGSGFAQILLIGTKENGVYYYADRALNSGKSIHHDDNYPNFVLDASGDLHHRSSPPYPSVNYVNNSCTIKKFIKHKTEQDADMYALVGIGPDSTDWDDDFGHHSASDEELWKIIDGNNEGDHEHFIFQRVKFYESSSWAIDNLLLNADFETSTAGVIDDWGTDLGVGATFTQSENNSRFGAYCGAISTTNTAEVSQAYYPTSIGISPATPKTYTFSVYLRSDQEAAVSANVVIIGLDSGGFDVPATGQTTVENLTIQGLWARSIVTATFSNGNVKQIKGYVELSTAGNISIDAAKLEEASSATAFNSGGLTTTDFTEDNHACYLNDMLSYNNHIIIGGLRDVRGEYGAQMDSPGYSYPAGAPTDEEYPGRPDGGINSTIDTIDGSATSSIEDTVIGYLASNEGLYYIDNMILQNTTYGIDIFNLFEDSGGTVWAGSRARLFKIHSERESSTSEYLNMYNDENAPLTFKSLVKVPAADNTIELIDPASPIWHTFISAAILNNTQRMGLFKGSVVVRNAPTSRVAYTEGRDYEVDYDPTSTNYGQIKRKSNPLFEGSGHGRIEPDQQVYIEYRYFRILEEVSGSEEGYKNLDLEDRTATINLPASVLAENYELYCDFVYTKRFKGVEDTNVNFNVPVIGIKENLKPYDYVTNPVSAHVWAEKYNLLAYSRDQRYHALYSDYQFSIPRIDIIQLNDEWNEDGFVASITAGTPHESAPAEPNPSVFSEFVMKSAIAGGGIVTWQHIWQGFEPTNNAIKMYTINVSLQDYFLNDIYDKRYYITKLQLWDYYIGIKSDTAAYFAFSKSLGTSNGLYFPEPKVEGDPSTAVTITTIEDLNDYNVCLYSEFPGGFDEQGTYDSEAEFKVAWDYDHNLSGDDIFGLATFDEYGVGKWKASGAPAHNPGEKRGVYVVAARSTGIGFDNKNTIQVNRNVTITQSFLDGFGDPVLSKDVYQFDLYYYLENAYNATGASNIEVKIYYEDEGEQYYSTIRSYSGGLNNLVEDKLDVISIRADAAIVPTRLEIITDGWDESDDFGPGPGDPGYPDARYVGGTHAFAGGYKAKLNVYFSSPKVYVSGLDYTKFYQNAARFGERLQYGTRLSGESGTLYLKFKPLFAYDFNYGDNSSAVLFDSRAIGDQENYFQIIYDAKNYNTFEALGVVDFSNLGTDANPYPRWPAESGVYYNSYKVVLHARELNIQQGAIDYKYRSYALDTNDTSGKSRYKFENNPDFQVFHTFLVTWERMEEMYPDATRYSDGYNNWQFRFTFYFDNLAPISKVIIIDPNILPTLSEKFQLGGGWVKESYNPGTETITWAENTSEGFVSELRLENEAIDHDKALLWINKQLPFLDANNIPIIQDILSAEEEIKLRSGITGEYSNLRLNDMFVEGDLYVMGSEIISNVSKMIIEDNIIEVNRIQEFDNEGNWIGVPEISHPVMSGLKSFRSQVTETYDSSLIWDESVNEWQLTQLSKFDLLFGDNVLTGASWYTQSTGSDSYLYTVVVKSDNTPTDMYLHSDGTWTLTIELKSDAGTPFDVRIRAVALLHDLSEIETTGIPFEITTGFQEFTFRAVYTTNDVEQVTLYVDVEETGYSADDIGHQNEFFAKTTIDTSTYEIKNETQDLRLRKAIIAAPIVNAGKEAFVTFEDGKSAIKVMAVDGLYINNNSLSTSMVFKAENDSETNIELQLFDNTGAYSNLKLGAVRPEHIENITNNEIITIFTGKVSNVQKYNLQISKSGHIEPGADATDIYFSSGNDTLQMTRIDADANIYFRQACLTNRVAANSATPLVNNVVESVSLDLGDGLGAQDCVRITEDQVGTTAPLVASELAIHNANNSNGIRHLQTYRLEFIGRVAGQPGHRQASIQHNLGVDLGNTTITFGASSPLRHVYWEPDESTTDLLMVKLDDENTMTTTNDVNPNNWVDPNDGIIIVYCTIMEQVPITAGITMS